VITERDLDAAIAECQGKRNPDASVCIKLAAFLTIKRELFGEGKEAGQPQYSFASAPNRNLIEIDSDSEFAKAIEGREQRDVMPVLDELMDTLSFIQPRLYSAVMNKLA
jgi:hypothetical protein